MKLGGYSLFLISVSLLFSTVTIFRIGSVGLPEVFGLLAIILSLPKFGLLLSSSFYIFRLTVLCVLVSLVLGSLITLIFQISSISIRDWIAWIYVIFFISTVIVNIIGNEMTVITISRILSWMPLLLMLILLLGTLGVVNVWFVNEAGLFIPFISRFVGLSTNPNQVGIAISALPFLCIYSFLNFKKGFRRWIFLISNLISLLIIVSSIATQTRCPSTFFVVI